MLVGIRKNWVTHVYITSENVKWYSHSEEQFGSFLMQIMCDPALASSGSYRREMQT